MKRNIFVTAPHGEPGRTRVNDVELAALKTIANREGLGLSEAVRFCIRQTARDLNLWPPQHPLIQNEGVKVR